MKDNRQVKKVIINQLKKYNDAMLPPTEHKEVARLIDKIEFTGLRFFNDNERKTMWAYLFEIFEESHS